MSTLAEQAGQAGHEDPKELRPHRGRGWGLAGTAVGGLLAAVGVLAIFVLALRLTGGAGLGWAAYAITAGVTGLGVALAVGRIRGAARILALGPTGIALVLTAALCVPLAPTGRHLPEPQPGAPVETWQLTTGSTVAAYHYRPTMGTPTRDAPVLFLAGGVPREVTSAEHRFWSGFTQEGYHVYLFDQAGSGRSLPLPDADYTMDRYVRDLTAVLDRIGAPQVHVVGFSGGGTLLQRAVADPAIASRFRTVTFIEPGAMDGATAELSGATGRMSGTGTQPVLTKPRYAVALGLALTGILPADNRFLTDAEANNIWTPQDAAAMERGEYCASDVDRIPEAPEPHVSANLWAGSKVLASVRADPRPIAPALRDVRVPGMVMLGECSNLTRAWHAALIRSYGALDRVHYVRGAGHLLWNGLDGHDAEVAGALLAFWAGEPATAPNYPQPPELETFLREWR